MVLNNSKPRGKEGVKQFLVAASLATLLLISGLGCDKALAATSEMTILDSHISYRWEVVRQQIGEDRARKLKTILKNSQIIIDAWACGSDDNKEPIGTRLYPGIVIDTLEKDNAQFKALFATELEEIQKLTNGKRFIADANGNKQDAIPDDTSAMVFDINKAYEGAIAEMEAIAYPKPGTNITDLTRTTAARTELEHARDVFQRYCHYLFG